ncbi:NADH-quinone oxidoreductase subunit L [compost metagenome]
MVGAVAQSTPGRFLVTWWFAAWGFDWLYDKLFIKPYLLACRLLARDPIDSSIGVIPRLARGGHGILSRSETGQLRWYAASIVGGAVLVFAAVLLA